MPLAPSRYWAIRCRGRTVAKFDTAGETLIPDSIDEYSAFNVVAVPSRSNLVSEPVDRSDLTDDELRLLSQVYRIL